MGGREKTVLRNDLKFQATWRECGWYPSEGKMKMRREDEEKMKMKREDGRTYFSTDAHGDVNFGAWWHFPDRTLSVRSQLTECRSSSKIPAVIYDPDVNEPCKRAKQRQPSHLFSFL
ncbi:mCG1051083 [Mus musculus]|nr:mCG1051083 [Mus musculus]